jgi:hypothetical protein
LEAVAVAAAGGKDIKEEAEALVKCKKVPSLCLRAAVCFVLSVLEALVALPNREEPTAKSQLYILPTEAHLQYWR